jgi:hypothetical protein
MRRKTLSSLSLLVEHCFEAGSKNVAHGRKQKLYQRARQIDFSNRRNAQGSGRRKLKTSSWLLPTRRCP